MVDVRVHGKAQIEFFPGNTSPQVHELCCFLWPGKRTEGEREKAKRERNGARKDGLKGRKGQRKRGGGGGMRRKKPRERER